MQNFSPYWPKKIHSLCAESSGQLQVIFNDQTNMWTARIDVCQIFLLLCGLCLQDVSTQAQEDWFQKGQQALQEAMKLRQNTGVAKNVILFIGDGMGVSTVTAARIYKGQLLGHPGEETQLSFEKFPHVALSKTYNADKQVPDSAGTSTAFMAGVKANYGTLGVDARVQRQNCSHLPDGKVTTIFDWSLAAEKSVGLVTTTRVTHATPAAAFAHTPERDWESDANMQLAPDDCRTKVKDIAAQLVEDSPNSDIKVILGGGMKHFTPYGTQIMGTFDFNMYGRLDGKDLTQIWLDDKVKRAANARFVWTKQQLDTVDVSQTDYLLGLFNQDHMQFELNRNITGAITEPSLSEMVGKAIGILRKDPEGFFLLVEGGRIDHAHHNNQAKIALAETVAFDDAIMVAEEMIGDDTLIVVSADHSHVLSIAGYPDRGHNILGIQDSQDEDAATDGMTYTTLSYANGPGPGRINLTGIDTSYKFFQQSRLVPTRYETHAGEDVAIYATGPMAHLFHGVQEQNYIAHVMAYASCVGPNLEHCKGRSFNSDLSLQTPGHSDHSVSPSGSVKPREKTDAQSKTSAQTSTASASAGTGKGVDLNNSSFQTRGHDDQTHVQNQQPNKNGIYCPSGNAASESLYVNAVCLMLVFVTLCERMMSIRFT